MPLGAIAGLVFLLSAGAVVGAYLMMMRQSKEALKRTVDHRLLELSGAVPAAGDAEESLFRQHKTGPLPALDRAAREAMKGLAIERWLEQSGVRLTISALFIISMILGAACAFVAMRFSHIAAVAALGFAAGVSLPFLFVRQRRSARLYKFEEHFPEALDLMSRAIRAGHAFSAGMKMAADELAEPVGPEFKKTFEEHNFGMSLKDALAHLCVRIPLLDVRFFATAVLIQKETGGNLSEILDNLAAVVRERFKVRRQVRVHTAHGRFTGYVLLAIPAFLALALSFINPEHMNMLFKDRMGQIMIVAAIVMQAIGWIWIKNVVKIEV